MKLKLLAVTLLASICLTAPAKAQPLPDPVLLDVPPSSSDAGEGFWHEAKPSDLILLLAVLGAFGALYIRFLQYKKEQQWQRAQFAEKNIHEIVREPELQKDIGKVLKALSSGPRFRTEILRVTNGKLYENEEIAPSEAKVPQEPLNTKPEEKPEDGPSPLDQFLETLERVDQVVEQFNGSKLVSPTDFLPFLTQWLQPIADRTYRSKDSDFYERLFDYIDENGYSGVQRLFKRYGYSVLPSPYGKFRFYPNLNPQLKSEFCLGTKQSSQKPTLEEIGEQVQWFENALSFAKMTSLVYETEDYIEDVGKGRRYKWGFKEFRFFDDPRTGTQAFAMANDKTVVVSFRGTGELIDWLTDARIKKVRFKAPPEGPIQGRVHRGFQAAWLSVADEILPWVKEQRTPEKTLWIAGHSLGAALATLATATLENEGQTVNGLYTFGQPRTGGPGFVKSFNAVCGDKTFRFVNNNDVVPQIPPAQFLYGHVGKLMYFDVNANLQFDNTKWGAILLDQLIGRFASTTEPWTDGILDHMIGNYIDHLQRNLSKLKLIQEKQAEKTNPPIGDKKPWEQSIISPTGASTPS
ncbi:lipase family protein [Leptolyngbya sp. FACHB-261]|uniref:lipase family protein n=1 Tax=Leptolyngbya sp. FACHB-261 TaxID=2692806 RepID=UPI001685DFCE|nr:lipase family protein [Leptolyngbya sp. FACHB-261]MBD2103273.1 lipase family protein [Leptolyngbya sp. FACHB-261]